MDGSAAATGATVNWLSNFVVIVAFPAAMSAIGLPWVMVILAGLAPIMWSEGAGSEVMQRIAAPMIGGMLTAPLLSMFVIPAAYLLMRRRELRSTMRSRQ